MFRRASFAAIFTALTVTALVPVTAAEAKAKLPAAAKKQKKAHIVGVGRGQKASRTIQKAPRGHGRSAAPGAQKRAARVASRSVTGPVAQVTASPAPTRSFRSVAPRPSGARAGAAAPLRRKRAAAPGRRRVTHRPALPARATRQPQSQPVQRPSGGLVGVARNVRPRGAPRPKPASEPQQRRGPAGPPVVRQVREIVDVVPGPLKAALGGLALLCLLLFGGYLFSTLRARHLARQRSELLHELGLLQTALLPPVPERIGGVRTSVAYRPAEGPAAGGDFYDALALPHGRAGFVLGDVSGHGREALSHTAFVRYTLRAYLEAGLEPGAAPRVGEGVKGPQLRRSLADVILGVLPQKRGPLSSAAAAHPAPITVGEEPPEPVRAAGSPAVGWDLSTGLRQTTIPLAAGSRALLYTDGLEEAPTRDGGRLGRHRLTEMT